MENVYVIQWQTVSITTGPSVDTHTTAVAACTGMCTETCAENVYGNIYGNVYGNVSGKHVWKTCTGTWF